MEIPVLRDLFDHATAEADKIISQAEAMETVLTKGEEGRQERSENKPIEIIDAVERDGRIEASVQGVDKVYSVRITLAPRRGYRCTCPDSRRRGRVVGPCKHTLALAAHWREKLAGDLDRIEGGLVNLLF